jgi:hypothetical protein
MAPAGRDHQVGRPGEAKHLATGLRCWIARADNAGELRRQRDIADAEVGNAAAAAAGDDFGAF